jgi:uncharacterized protein (TIRG00374 family)
VLILLWLALREISWASLLSELRRLLAVEILLLFAVNVVVILILSARWWVILRAQGYRIHYLWLSAYRLAGFAISYFTPGPQFGGEPLQVYLVSKRHTIPATSASASVVLDKAIELLGNFTFLVFGLSIVLEQQFLPSGAGEKLLYLSFGLLSIPFVFLLSALFQWKPFARLHDRLSANRSGEVGPLGKATGFLRETEALVDRFARNSIFALIAAMGFSLLSWVALVGEYWLATSFLELRLSLMQAVAVLTAARIAFLTPLPGGLGALEAGQIFALNALGFNPEDGAAMALIIRARDLVFGGLGLVLGATLHEGKDGGAEV